MDRNSNALLVVGLTVAATLIACGSSPAPDFSSLSLRMPYDELAAIAGGQCEHVHDRGVRILQWHYEDGSIIEAGIHDGALSGLNVIDPPDSTGRSTATTKSTRSGLQADMPEADLRDQLGDSAITTHDSSDRECRWTYDDGTLTALLLRGKLNEAVWRSADGAQPAVLVSVSDPVEMMLADLASEQEWDRARALQELEGVDDPRLADALLDLLRIETVKRNRGKAALRLAAMGDSRASDLLLPDLDQDPISEDIIKAMGTIGDLRADAALEQAAERVSSPRTRTRIRAARTQIQRRHGALTSDAFGN